MKNINEGHTTNGKRKRQREAKLRNRERSSIMKRIIMNNDSTQTKMIQPLHILSNHEYNNIKKNNIQVRNMKSVSGTSTHSQNITIFEVTEEDIGINLKKHFNVLSQKNVINVSMVKRKFVTISMELSELNNSDNSIKYIGTSPVNSSGMILLMIATYNELCKKEENVNTYMNLFQRLRYPIGSNGNKNYHHGTKGRNYGVGLVAKYKKDKNGLSFGTYAEKLQGQEQMSPSYLDIGKIREQESSRSYELYKIIDKLMSASLKKPLEILPHLHKNIMIVGDSIKSQLKELPSQVVDELNLEELRSYISAQFNLNSVTHVAHTELDQSSTVIYVPQQNPFYPKYYFEFILNHFTAIQINLIPGTTIVYSSHLLVHRQISSIMRHLSIKKQHKKKYNVYMIPPNSSKKDILHDSSPQERNFINISAYFNKRLYESIQKSLRRLSKYEKEEKSL